MVQTPIQIDAQDDRLFSKQAFEELIGTQVALNGDAANGTLVAADVEDSGQAVTLVVETDDEIVGLQEPVAVRLLTSVEAHLAA